MSVARLATGVALVITLITPVGVVAQTDDDASGARAAGKIVRIWTDKDGLVIVEDLYPETADTSSLDVVISPPEDRPEALQRLQMDRPFLTVDGIEPGAKLEIVRVYESDGDPGLFNDDEGMQLVPQVKHDGESMSWMLDQRQLRVPPPCSEGGRAEGCLEPGFRTALVNELVGQPLGAGFLPPDVSDDFLVVTRTTGPGSFFGFGGGITFDQVPTTGDDGVIIEGEISVKDAFGGRLRDVRAQVVGFDDPSGDLVFEDISPRLGDPFKPGRSANTWTIPVPCPAGESPIVVATEVDVRRAGNGLAPALGPDFDPLRGGTRIRVIDVQVVDCPGVLANTAPDTAVGGPPDDVLAGLLCLSYSVVHDELRQGSGEELVVFPSFIIGRGVVLVQGTVEDMQAYVAVREWNRDRGLVVPLIPVTGPDGNDILVGSVEDDLLDGGDDLLVDAGEDDPVDGIFGSSDDFLVRGSPRLQVFEFEGGIESFGKKRLNKLEIRSDAGTADLTRQARAAIGGKNIKVRAQEDSGGNCPVDLSDLDLSDPNLDMIAFD